MKTKRRRKRTATEIAFSVLVYEFAHNDPRKSDEKIKRRLRNQGFRRFPDSKIELIRRIKNLLQKEISSGARSKYFVKRKRISAELHDFDIDRLAADIGRQFPTVSAQRIKSFVCFAVFVYWML